MSVTSRPMEDLSAAERILVYLRDVGAVVDKSGSATPALAAACLIKKQNASVLIGDLAARDLIARDYDAAGRRTYRIELTEAGKKFAKKIESTFEKLPDPSPPAEPPNASAAAPKSRHLAPLPDRRDELCPHDLPRAQCATCLPITPDGPSEAPLEPPIKMHPKSREPLEEELAVVAVCVGHLMSLASPARHRVVRYLRDVVVDEDRP